MKPSNWLDALPFAVGFGLLLAYNRGDMPKIIEDFDIWETLSLMVFVGCVIAAIHLVVRVSYWIFPKRQRPPDTDA